MGKGKSSDVYYCDIYSVDVAKRQFKATLTPTGASDYSLCDSGHETLFLSVLWERLPFDIRYRRRFEKALLTEEDKMIKNSVGSVTYNSIDISRFAFDRKQRAVGEGEDIFDAWNKLSDEEKQPYIDYSNNKKQQANLLVQKLIKEQNLPPLAELSVDDICRGLNKIAWRYIQKVIIEGEEESEDEDGNSIPSGRYTVIVTDPKWLIGLKEGSDGTTAYEQELGTIKWTKELHHYFPVSFRERTKILLMMRLPQRATTNTIGMLPEPLFLLMLQYLAVMTYEEDTVEPWEMALRTNDTKRVLEIHESAMQEQKKPRR